MTWRSGELKWVAMKCFVTINKEIRLCSPSWDRSVWWFLMCFRCLGLFPLNASDWDMRSSSHNSTGRGSCLMSVSCDGYRILPSLPIQGARKVRVHWGGQPPWLIMIKGCISTHLVPLNIQAYPGRQSRLQFFDEKYWAHNSFYPQFI